MHAVMSSGGLLLLNKGGFFVKRRRAGLDMRRAENCARAADKSGSCTSFEFGSIPLVMTNTLFLRICLAFSLGALLRASRFARVLDVFCCLFDEERAFFCAERLGTALGGTTFCLSPSDAFIVLPTSKSA